VPIINCPSCNERISVEELSGTYICPECNDEFHVEDTDEVENDNGVNIQEAQKSGGGILGTILLLIVVFLLFKWLSGPKWTLLVCEDLLNPPYRYECQDVDIVLKNTYKTLDACWTAGEGYMNSYPGFECGYKCKYDTSWGSWMCDKINE